MKKKILFILLTACSLAACGPKSHAEKLKESIKKQNKSYPIRLSETVTIDSTTYSEINNTLSYYYSVTGELDDSAFMDKNYASYKEALQEAVNNSVELEDYRKYGTTFRYIYYSGSNGKQLAEFSFNSPN